jgi:hypothetical protein
MDSKYHWTESEHYKYLQFLEKESALFNLSIADKKRKRIHEMMSKKIKSRNSHQCRSHHQKMLIKWRTIEGILQSHCHWLHP